LERCYFEQFCRLVHLGRRVLCDRLPRACDLANGWTAFWAKLARILSVVISHGFP